MNNKDFRNCYTNDCCDCPNYEECQDQDNRFDDDGDTDFEEQYENNQFAQDDLPCDYDLDMEFEDRISGYEGD